MYLPRTRKPRKTNRKRCARHQAKLAQKNRRRRNRVKA